MALHNAHIGYGRHHETFLYGSPPALTRDLDRADGYRRSPLYLASLPAANAAPADHSAYSALGTAGEGYGGYRPYAERAADDAPRAIHRERLQQGLQHAQPPPAGRGRFDAPVYGRFDAPAFASAPTAPVGQPNAAWTTQPRTSAAAAPPRPPSPKFDFGADFGRENASKFYQNAIATHQPSISSKAPPLVLKELPIQKFSGEIRAYPVFRNRFIETVGGRSDLEPRHKFQYLLQCLEGEPLRLATGYLITDKNYFKLLDRLEDRYGDNSTLVNLLAQDLINMKPVSQTAKDLRRFHDEALRLADEMEQAGKDIDDNVLWRQTLISKMPQSLRNKIYENMRKDPLSAPVNEILACVADYLRVLERGEIALSWNATADGNSGRGGLLRHPDPRSTPHRAGTHTNDADVTYAANAKRCRRIKCAYCGRDHWASKCDIYVSIAQRYRRARQLNYCLLCLRVGHWIGSCPKKTYEACEQCHDGHHHRSLCPATFRNGHRPSASLRHSPVRATTPGVPGLPKNEHGSSSQQEHRDTTSVSRPGAPEPHTAQTVRFPSAHPSSVLVPSNSKKPRRKKSKDPRTDPQGRDGTTCPTTTSVAENVKQMDANACGGDGLLSGHLGHLTTDRRSTTAEAPWDDRMLGYGSGTTLGLLDTSWKCALWADEEASLPPSPGHCSNADTEPSSDEQDDDDPRFAPADIFQDYSGYAVSTTLPADDKTVLLECLMTTAINVNNGLSRPAIVFFDSGSNCSYISMQLAKDLRLPCLEKQLVRVNTFGTDATTTIKGYATTVALLSPYGYSVQLVLTASDRIVPAVTTALITDDEVEQLQNNKCSLISTRETPDLLIGLDLEYLFDYKRGPRLPSGFHIAKTNLGLMAGGAGKVASHRKIGSTTIAAVTTDFGPSKSRPPSESAQPTGHSTMPPSVPAQQRTHRRKRRLDFTDRVALRHWMLKDIFAALAPTNLVGPEGGDSKLSTNPKTTTVASATPPTVIDASTHCCELVGDTGRPCITTGRLQLQRKDLSVDPPACSAAGTIGRLQDDLAYSSAYLPGNTEYCVNNECTEPSSSLLLSSERSSTSRVSGILPQSPQKQFPSNPLDTQLLLLPTNASTLSDVEVVPVAYSALTPPTPLRGPPSSTEAELRRSPPPQPIFGNQICAASYDARSTTKRKTRLRPCLPDLARQHLGIYTSPQSVVTVNMLPPSDSTFVHRPRAKWSPRPVSMTPSTPSQAGAATYSVPAQAHAPPPSSTTTVEQNPSVTDVKAATDAGPPSDPPATSDAATPSTTDAPAIAAPPANQAVSATTTDVEIRITSVAADVAAMKDVLLQLAAALPGLAPNRPPNRKPGSDD